MPSATRHPSSRSHASSMAIPPRSSHTQSTLTSWLSAASVAAANNASSNINASNSSNNHALTRPIRPTTTSTRSVPVVDKTSASRPQTQSQTNAHTQLKTETNTENKPENKLPSGGPERNIDNVVFGDLMFKTWYPSYHVKEIVGKDVVDSASATGAVGAGAGNTTSASGKHGHHHHGPPTQLERLFVCNRCFKYSKELIAWKAHMRVCQKEVPGEKIYSHGVGTTEEGVWSVWEVDGEVESLYCQNLSLFGKLFLDNKSVFFDVTGFNYFLLVHTSPSTGMQQVVGFFSKEKMSWDNNNLACILIFPPWQRKNLGAILIGVSYEISRREKILGGPEKPISALGRRSYNRYWQAEIARFLLDVKETDTKRGKGLVTIEDISNATWICHEDVLLSLREMGIAHAAGKRKDGSPRVKIDKEEVRQWVAQSGTELERAIDPEGFAEGYAMPEEEDEEMED